MKTIGLILFALLITECSSTNIDFKETVYWVNSTKVDCTGVGKMNCLQVQNGNELDLNKEWNLFYSQIIGFDYEPSFIYKLNIKEETIENPPADGSSIKYTLIEVLEKKQDTRYNIHDIYILKSIHGKELQLSDLKKQPNLEINITKMMISGNNGCNNYSGSITELNDKNINFGLLAETRMLCKNMEIPTQFSEAISNTKSFKKDSEDLHFINELGITLLTFKKVD